MKTIRHSFLFLWIAAAALAGGACSEDDKVDPNIDIPGLGGETGAVQTATDRWLYENYVVPYNIEVQYRWDASDMQSSPEKQLTPVEESFVVPFMQVMHAVWFNPYEQTAGENFVREVTPKKVVLVGSPEYEFGSIKLGQAEGGRKILLLNVNGFDPSSAANIKRFLHTIEHEFAHIMHQTVLFDKTYETISAGLYSPTNWTSFSGQDARGMGFITNYAMSGKDEDFVEMISMIMVYGREWFENTVIGEARNATAVAALRKKEAMVVEYLKSVWDIRFYDEGGRKGIVTLVQEAIDQVVKENTVNND